MRRALKIMDFKEVRGHDNTAWNKSALFAVVGKRIVPKTPYVIRLAEVMVMSGQFTYLIIAEAGRRQSVQRSLGLKSTISQSHISSTSHL